MSNVLNATIYEINNKKILSISTYFDSLKMLVQLSDSFIILRSDTDKRMKYYLARLATESTRKVAVLNNKG
jgi:hypothetical protein